MLLGVYLFMGNIVTLTQDFYKNYRKPPEKHFAEIEFQCDQVQSLGISTNDYAKLLKQAMSENVYMPSIQKILDMYEPPKVNRVEVPCIKCNKIGRIYGVKFFFDDDTRMDVISMDQRIRTEGRYLSLCIGRCDCSNGEVYPSLPIAQPPKFVMDMATRDDFDCPFVTDNVAKELNAKRLGKKWPPPMNKKWDEVVQNIIVNNNIGESNNE